MRKEFKKPQDEWSCSACGFTWLTTEDMFKGGFDPNKRFIHGFSMNVGPDGKPKFQEFGNRPTKNETGEPILSEEREPLTDIIEGDE